MGKALNTVGKSREKKNSAYWWVARGNDRRAINQTAREAHTVWSDYGDAEVIVDCNRARIMHRCLSTHIYAQILDFLLNSWQLLRCAYSMKEESFAKANNVCSPFGNCFGAPNCSYPPNCYGSLDAHKGTRTSVCINSSPYGSLVLMIRLAREAPNRTLDYDICSP